MASSKDRSRVGGPGANTARLSAATTSTYGAEYERPAADLLRCRERSLSEVARRQALVDRQNNGKSWPPMVRRGQGRVLRACCE